MDGFLGAFWARPHAYLDPQVQAGISSFSRTDAQEGLDRLRADLESGADGLSSRRFASRREDGRGWCPVGFGLQQGGGNQESDVREPHEEKRHVAASRQCVGD